MGIQPHLAHTFTYQWPLCIRTELSGCDRLYSQIYNHVYITLELGRVKSDHCGVMEVFPRVV